jgi:hypothetical protein
MVLGNIFRVARRSLIEPEFFALTVEPVQTKIGGKPQVSLVILIYIMNSMVI